MDSRTVELVLFIQQLTVIAAKAIAELVRSGKDGDEPKPINVILHESDKRYLKVISTQIPTP